MKLSNLTLFVIVLIIAGIILLVTGKKKEKETSYVRPYKKTITVPGHSRSKPKNKRKNRRSGKR
ncbi:hypothetical protein DP113_29695 [Brasilonema octagenarum UFV-E1]|uniref:Uncharacterized protein n=2 Tax=Brasilonema TaxID=383614 RepID=A0A856MM82_9CYAN|nr:hypothetical protein [Brasilonema octagenarum UFV-OR1]QDL11489.1 hypothetical protein DP114_29535 [Brasilonema sennae CENA114]QDL17872.1 hypothetical protein DP113_29695 [Brasilonema octagenarum UFV-E1]